MKRLLVLLMVAVVTLSGGMWVDGTVATAAPIAPNAVPAKQTNKYKLKGDNASAEFFNVGACLSTYAVISVGESVTKDEPGKPATDSMATVFVFRYDGCTGEAFSGGATTTLPEEAFHMQGNLVAATLNTEVELFDFAGSYLSLATINLTWTGEGSVTKDKNKSHDFDAPGCKLTVTSVQGSSRAATASGSIMVDGVDYTAQPTQLALLSSIKEGTLTVGCE